MLDKIPTIQEELNRKVLLAIQKMQFDRDSGKCTHAQFQYALSVMWESVAGLVDAEFTEMAEIMGAYVINDSSNVVTKAYFHPIKNWTGFICNYLDGIVTLRVYHNASEIISKGFDLREEPNCYKAGIVKFSSLCENLAKQGFNSI